MQYLTRTILAISTTCIALLAARWGFVNADDWWGFVAARWGFVNADD